MSKSRSGCDAVATAEQVYHTVLTCSELQLISNPLIPHRGKVILFEILWGALPKIISWKRLEPRLEHAYRSWKHSSWRQACKYTVCTPAMWLDTSHRIQQPRKPRTRDMIMDLTARWSRGIEKFNYHLTHQWPIPAVICSSPAIQSQSNTYKASLPPRD